MQICFVTSNKHKLSEVQQILKGFDIKNVSPVIVEIQGTKEEVVLDKATRAYEILKEPVIVDDTSLELSALNGLPGPYTVHFINKIGCRGIHDLLDSFKDKDAKAITMVAYCDGKTTKVFEGAVPGTIVAPRGKHDFGFDPIFLPKGSSKTYGEMEPEEKNGMSHRAKAFKQLRTFLEANFP